MRFTIATPLYGALNPKHLITQHRTFESSSSDSSPVIKVFNVFGFFITIAFVLSEIRIVFRNSLRRLDSTNDRRLLFLLPIILCMADLRVSYCPFCWSSSFAVMTCFRALSMGPSSRSSAFSYCCCEQIRTIIIYRSHTTLLIAQKKFFLKILNKRRS